VSVAAYLLIGEAPSADFAARIAVQYKDCPQVHFIASFGTMLVGVWYLPEAKRWWLELVAQHPQVALGLSRAAVYRAERPGYPEEAPTRSTRAEGPLAPCGSDCRACGRGSVGAGGCCGCPALVEGCAT
jgi:hypothetical protein